ncbi:glycosyltransferase family 4 protein [Halotalea alkalilenta]|uniref:Glycosyl transferase family 1 n=1 Tax=Halotalea alkalilenta TaxID=376489 RepID=A0A172YIP3_9GAMM|nr:glycosyltransferase family 1 protein [Halotalea alkalilenta]ANF58935.1 hypothetical protein A5892_16880 [Halotalea alkalilenta]
MSRAEYVFDERWIGEHGIGRFAGELFQRVDGLHGIQLGGKPSGALDPLKTGLWLLRHPHKRLFTPGYNAPLFARSRSVITVHDLNHIDVDESSSALKRLYYAQVLKPACRQARRVLTVSAFSRQRIIDWSGASPERVINVGNGVSSVFGVEAAAGESPSTSRYFFCVSNRKSHKNERRLIEAFAKARLPEDVELMMTGQSTAELDEQIARLGAAARIRFTGRLDDAQLAACYRHAIALLFPSLYEGFGLPVVEAMACGTPVLTSTVTSLPEIAGDAAWLVDPLRVDEIRQGIERLHDDADLRARLRDKGIERARSFSWERVAERVRLALQ